jgi:hypothetical protein
LLIGIEEDDPMVCRVVGRLWTVHRDREVRQVLPGRSAPRCSAHTWAPFPNHNTRCPGGSKMATLPASGGGAPTTWATFVQLGFTPRAAAPTRP